MTRKQLEGWLDLFLMRFTQEELQSFMVGNALEMLAIAERHEEVAAVAAEATRMWGDPDPTRRYDLAKLETERRRVAIAAAIEVSARAAARQKLAALSAAAAYELDERGWLRPTEDVGDQRHTTAGPQWGHRLTNDFVTCVLYLPEGEEVTDEHLQWIGHAVRSG